MHGNARIDADPLFDIRDHLLPGNHALPTDVYFFQIVSTLK
ncbi:MAG: hypothetical protein PHY05_10325 [Methanothrix sp.]|nr:hypothetical protein [Methanothrix sp.]